MKVLIGIQHESIDHGAMTYLGKEILRLFNMNHIEGYIVTDEIFAIHNEQYIHVEPLRTKAPFFHPLKKTNGATMEELLYESYHFLPKYIETYMNTFLSAIDRIQPDVIIDLLQPFAIVAGRLKNIPVYSYVNMASYRHKPFDSVCLKDFNTYLKNMHLEQILYLSDLYAFSTKTFTFTTNYIQPFHNANPNFYRFKSMVEQIPTSNASKVFVLLNTLGEKEYKKQAKLFEDAFLGSKQKVCIVSPYAKMRNDGNLSYSNHLDNECFKQAQVIYHNGNERIFEQCLVNGIPQIIINDSTYIHNWNANAIRRNKIGEEITKAYMNVSSIYESYRKIFVNNAYFNNAQLVKEELNTLPSFHEFLYLFISIS